MSKMEPESITGSEALVSDDTPGPASPKGLILLMPTAAM